MKQLSAEELEEILNNSMRKLDFVLELAVLQEPRLSVKPVYKFGRAFAEDETIPEFCLIYSEADDPDMISVSLNSKKFEKILREYKFCKIIFYGDNNINNIGELRESYYYDRKDTEIIKFPNCRLLTPGDKHLAVTCGKDDYLNVIFENFIEKKLWPDCGIIGAFDEINDFAGYLAYYEIAENIRDVSYIYVKREYRGIGYAKKLLKYFKNKNIEENKISYYSYAENNISKTLAQSCGFTPCARRYEIERD